jgi:hypothetical protein
MKRQALMVNGSLRLIPQLPPLKLLEFIDWLKILDDRPSPEIEQAVCDRCLELHGIGPGDYEGDLLDLISGPLSNLNKPEPSPVAGGAPDGDTVSIEEWAFSVVAALIESEGLGGAIYAAETHPADLISGILAARSRQLHPPGKNLNSPENEEDNRRLDEFIFANDPPNPSSNADPTSHD